MAANGTNIENNSNSNHKYPKRVGWVEICIQVSVQIVLHIKSGYLESNEDFGHHLYFKMAATETNIENN